MHDPTDNELIASSGQGDLPPIKARQETLRDGMEPRDTQIPFAVTEDEARCITALPSHRALQQVRRVRSESRMVLP